MAPLLHAWFYLFLCLDAESTFVKKLTVNFGSLHSLLPRLSQRLHLGAFSVLNPVCNGNGYPLRPSSLQPAQPLPMPAAVLTDASDLKSSGKEEAPVSGIHVFSLFGRWKRLTLEILMMF